MKQVFGLCTVTLMSTLVGVWQWLGLLRMGSSQIRSCLLHRKIFLSVDLYDFNFPLPIFPRKETIFCILVLSHFDFSTGVMSHPLLFFLFSLVIYFLSPPNFHAKWLGGVMFYNWEYQCTFFNLLLININALDFQRTL